jgi:serine/threonine protein kinase
MDLADAADRFARDARAAAALNHPNIVTIHDFGEYNSQPYIVMEYVPGETQIIRRKEPLRLSDKLRYIDNLAFAVSYAHGVGIIHRDIKPTNLMVDRSGRLKVLDFGIARILGTLGSNATALIGTPGYMAPEQILGGSIDARSDLFSIGVVSYELLSYTDAFPGETIPTITHRILTQEPSPLGQVIPGLPPELIAVIEKAIKKKADERFDDVESFRAAIGSLRPQIDDDPPLSWLPTTIRSGPPSAAARFGTGSVKQPIVDSVAALTPPPAPESSRQNREHILRRRTERIEAALADSKSAFERGELDVALDACFQALTLDDTHVGALNLEQSIQNAIARRRANTLLEEARGHLDVGALTSAHDLLQQARSLNPEAPDVKLLERDLRLARAEQERLRQRGNTVKGAVDAATQALHRGELETALAFARQALELDPTCVPAKAIEAQALQKIDEEIGSVTPSAVVALAPSLGMASTAADSAATVIASRPVTPLPAKRMVAPKPVPDEKGPSAKATGKIPKALPSARKQQRRS